MDRKSRRQILGGIAGSITSVGAITGTASAFSSQHDPERRGNGNSVPFYSNYEVDGSEYVVVQEEDHQWLIEIEGTGYDMEINQSKQRRNLRREINKKPKSSNNQHSKSRNDCNQKECSSLHADERNVKYEDERSVKIAEIPKEVTITDNPSTRSEIHPQDISNEIGTSNIGVGAEITTYHEIRGDCFLLEDTNHHKLGAKLDWYYNPDSYSGAVIGGTLCAAIPTPFDYFVNVLFGSVCAALGYWLVSQFATDQEWTVEAVDKHLGIRGLTPVIAIVGAPTLDPTSLDYTPWRNEGYEHIGLYIN